MSVASIGAISTLGLLIIGASNPVVPSFVFVTLLITYICFAMCALIRREFGARVRNLQRWRQYGWGGMGIGATYVTGNAVTRFEYGTPALPPRWGFLILATAIAMITAGLVIRYYVLPQSVAIEAAYKLRVYSQDVLMKNLTQGDAKLASDAARVLKWANVTPSLDKDSSL
jgi:hypothetical protein